jgi:dTDP-4-dehydrorhamnose reductase
MNNILILGANGQVGSEFRDLESSYKFYNFFFTDRESLDITDEYIIERFCIENSIDTIINAAAYTAVDRAEEESELANKINHLAVKNLAHIAKKLNIRLIHISTDYVFDGKSYQPYHEDITPNPTSIYGQSKLDGELAMRLINPQNSIIIRTSWVYSSYGANFVKTMIRLGRDRDELGVVFDQIGTPTYARDIAEVILDILPKIETKKVEIYHYSNEGVLSWYDFAKEVMKMAKISCKINPIESYEYPTPASRPYYSLLNKAKIKKTFDIKVPFWKDSLDECLRKMGERN